MQYGKLFGKELQPATKRTVHRVRRFFWLWWALRTFYSKHITALWSVKMWCSINGTRRHNCLSVSVHKDIYVVVNWKGEFNTLDRILAVHKTALYHISVKTTGKSFVSAQTFTLRTLIFYVLLSTRIFMNLYVLLVQLQPSKVNSAPSIWERW